MELIFVVILSLLFIWMLRLWSYRVYLKIAYKLPSNKWHTFLGFGKIITPKNSIVYFKKCSDKYGSSYIVWMGPFPLFCTNDPQILGEILTSKNCIKKPWLYNTLSNVIGTGLITESEPEWSSHRKLLNKAFTSKILFSFFPIFHNEINDTIQEINDNLDKDKSVFLLRLFQELSVKNATQTTLKRKIQLTKLDLKQFTEQIHVSLDYVIKVVLNVFLNIDYIRNLAEKTIYIKDIVAMNIAQNLINESMDIKQNNNVMEDPSYLDDVTSVIDIAFKGLEENLFKVEDMQSELFHVFVGAFETTSSTLYFALILLAMHPEYQDRAYEEIIRVVPTDDETIMTLDDLNQLTYLEMIFNETLRVLPVVPMIFREVENEPLKLSNGLQLPVGQIICVDIFSLGRKKELWGPKADEFNPDNFSAANIDSRHSFSYIPFTKGLRVCIGRKYGILFSKMCLAKIIKNFKFSTDFRYEDLRFENHISLKLTEHPPIRIERR